MFNKILVPLDGSDLAECALGPALRIAKGGHREVILLRVPLFTHKRITPHIEYDGLPPSEQSIELLRNEVCHYLMAVQQAMAPPGLPVRAEVVEGDVASVIVDTAETECVDLIVMSSHGYSGLTRWMLGSVTEKVLRSTPCPVMIVRSPKPLSKVLITLDGSELAELAVAPGIEMTNRLDAQLTLLCVQDESMHRSRAERAQIVSEGSERDRPLADRLYESMETYLRNLAQRHRLAAGREIQTAVVTGPAAESILDFAESHRIDLIIMATHGQTGLHRWVYGSVTAKVLRCTHCAVLVIRLPTYKLRIELNRQRL